MFRPSPGTWPLPVRVTILATATGGWLTAIVLILIGA